jgi:hypothetical protein
MTASRALLAASLLLLRACAILVDQDDLVAGFNRAGTNRRTNVATSAGHKCMFHQRGFQSE